MAYKLTKEGLGNDLLFSTLQALKKCMSEYNLFLYVVGATARDITMKILNEVEPKRRTIDLDVAIAIEHWDDFDKICRTLEANHFVRVGNTQKFIYKGEEDNIEYEVDIVPFGGIAVDEQICWPPEGNPVMSVKCLEDVMKQAVDIEIDNALHFKIAPLCGQFLIKLDAWNDRHQATSKDADDMFYIVSNYFDAQLLGNSVTPPDCVELSEDKSTIVYGSQWLGYDVSQMLSTEHLLFYIELLKGETADVEHSELIYHLMRAYGDDKEDAFEQCLAIIKSLVTAFTNELHSRQCI
jgi:hypothetical protein bacD2_22162